MPTIDRGGNGRGVESERASLPAPRAPIIERGESRAIAVERAAINAPRTALSERGDITRGVISEPPVTSTRDMPANRTRVEDRSIPSFSLDGSTLPSRYISPSRARLNERAAVLLRGVVSEPTVTKPTPTDKTFGEALTNSLYASGGGGGYRTGSDTPIAVVAGDGGSSGGSSGLIIIVLAVAAIGGYFLYQRYLK